MNFCFCVCAREHKWSSGVKAICHCGRVLEPQTLAEFDQRKLTHEATLERIANALASGDDLKPVVRLFRD